MSSTDGVHVVVGASGGTGRALVRELLRRIRRVRAVNRSGRLDAPPGVEVAAGDARDAERIREVCRGAGVVYNTVNVPFAQSQESFPAAVDGVLSGARAADATMVFAVDTWMYGRVTGPMTEALPYRPVSDKGVLRAWLAERVIAAHTGGRVRTVIGRAPELYGPAVESVLGHNLFGPALSHGPTLSLPDRAMNPPHPTSDDVREQSTPGGHARGRYGRPDSPTGPADDTSCSPLGRR